jgi:NAD(P)-dependent dehydrogenase (short-subunit alcohol dehydrogenase family)
MRRENAVKKVDELSSLHVLQPRQKLFLHRGSLFLKHGEMGASTRGGGDDVAAAVAWVGAAFDLVGCLEAGHDAVHVVAIQPQDPPEVGLAERTLLHQARQHGEVGPRLRGHVLGGQPRPDRRHPTGLPAHQSAQRFRNSRLIHAPRLSVGETNESKISLVKPTKGVSMNNTTLTGRRVLVPGGTGGVGEGVVRAFLAVGADVVVPTRSHERGAELRQALGEAGTSRLLHLPTHDYTTFAGADELGKQMTERLGGIDDVIAPIGGWWSGRALTQIGEDDWAQAFVGLATVHMALARAILPRMSGAGAYTVVVGQSAEFPIPGSGLVSMEQSAVLMMQRVLAAENTDRRVLALVLGQVRTRFAAGEPDWVSAQEVGNVALAASTAASVARDRVDLPSSAAARAYLAGQN